MYWDGEQAKADMCDSAHFDDVQRGQWFFHYVCSAKDHGIVEGYPGTRTFGPDRSITVAEASKMIVNAFKITTAAGEGPWYAPYIRSLASRHALPLNLPALDASLTRGQLAEIAYRLGTNDTTKPTLTYGLMTSEGNSTDPCVAYPEQTATGDVSNPVASTYARLKKLGPIFTALDCGNIRLHELYGDLSGKVSALRIVLRNPPSNGLYNALYGIGFAPINSSVAATSLQWQLTDPVTIGQLLTLKAFESELSYDQ
jgi:hypothetical protein